MGLSLHDRLPAPSVESSDLFDIVAINTLPFRICHGSCNMVLHVVELQFSFVEVVSTSHWLSVEIRILYCKLVPDLNLTKVSIEEARLSGSVS